MHYQKKNRLQNYHVDIHLIDVVLKNGYKRILNVLAVGINCLKQRQISNNKVKEVSLHDREILL